MIVLALGAVIFTVADYIAKKRVGCRHVTRNRIIFDPLVSSNWSIDSLISSRTDNCFSRYQRDTKYS